jgi:hypothetical protein
VTTIAYRGGSEWPAFPAVRIQLSGVIRLQAVTTWGKIDTGASRTIVPLHLLEQIGAYRHPRQVAGCRGYDGTIRVLPVYEVDLSIDDPRWPDEVETAFASTVVVGVSCEGRASRDDTEVLLGRDVLAAWHLHLDGRNGHYTVT